MSVQESEAGHRPAPAPEVPRDPTAADGQAVGLRRLGAPTSRPQRPRDYRLRGLDLDAPALAEAPAGPKRTRHPSLRRRRRRLLVKLAVAVAITVVVAGVLRATVVQPYSVSTTSMVPTLWPGTDVLVVEPHLLVRSIDRGDIIVFHQSGAPGCAAEGDGTHDLVKRVIGLPGQTIWSEGERIYVDGRLLEEPGWYNPPFGELGPTPIARTTIPAGSYFVMGDNRTDTCDSRVFGAVSSARVVGKVVATIARDGHPSVHLT
jgi:signal peptidase I